MLETPQERVELLKSGITGKKIEELYIKYNNFKIVGIPASFELVEIHSNESKIVTTAQRATVIG